MRFFSDHARFPTSGAIRGPRRISLSAPAGPCGRQDPLENVIHSPQAILEMERKKVEADRVARHSFFLTAQRVVSKCGNGFP
jgi:hypothetical protein